MSGPESDPENQSVATEPEEDLDMFQRQVKNTQIYEFYHFPKNGRMQCGL